MSKYEWESGTIKIPAKEWAGFRTKLIKAHNVLEETRLKQATQMHAKLKELLKGKRGEARQEVMDRFEEKCRHVLGYDEKVIGMVLETKWSGGKQVYVLKGAPRKKDIEILPTTKDCVLSAGDEATITLRNDDRTVTWSVNENNHACDRARRHPMGGHLFRALAGIEWTRGSGGKIVGNDEYNSDADYAGGGGNYVTDEFGPEAQKRQRKELARFNRMTGTRSTGRSWY